MHPVRKLITYGQSYGMDNLTRGMMTSGEIYERLVVTDVQAAWAAEASGPRRDGHG
jgi:hypothetical protein